MIKKVIKVLIFVLLVFVIGFFIVWMDTPAYESNKFIEFLNLKEELRLELIDEIRNGNVDIDENNYVIITDKYDGIAKNNNVYTLKCDEEECVVSFLYKPGFPDEDQYLYYSSKDEKLIEKNLDKSLYNYIKKVKEHWYFVQYN
mgnify:CR=1 FL=1